MTSTAVRVLGVCEILEVVAAQMTYHDLSIFAQVARVVSDPCLDVLWKRLPTAFPLLALLPSVTKRNGCYILNPERPIQDNEWKIFDRYSRRVHFIARQFSSTTRGSVDIDFPIFRSLENLRHQSLFPRLRTLVVSIEDIVTFSRDSCENSTAIEELLLNLAPFILPRLTQVNLVGHNHEACLLTHEILKYLAKSNPDLHHLRIDNTLDSQILMSVQYFPRLKIFDFGFDSHQPYYQQFLGMLPSPNIHITLFDAVSTMNTLSTLLVNCERMAELVFASRVPIPNILQLAIKVSRCHIIGPIFHFTPNLTTLSISVRELRIQDMHELGSGLFSCLSLRTLEVSAFCTHHPTPKSTMAMSMPNLFDFVRPFKNLQLEALVIECRMVAEIEVSHSIIAEIGRSFPRLQKLHLLSKTPVTTSSFVPINIGMAMARLCPDLCDFRVYWPLSFLQGSTPLATLLIESTFQTIHPTLIIT